MSELNPRQGLKALLCLIGAMLLASCATLSPSGVQPVKSPNDDYQYRLLTLGNKMEVLLISDPDTPKAAASLDVLVGSGDNPPGRAGLAHFLEHMLFLGTDKYPDAAEYERFITEHGVPTMPIPASKTRIISLTSTLPIYPWPWIVLPSSLLRPASRRNM